MNLTLAVASQTQAVSVSSGRPDGGGGAGERGNRGQPIQEVSASGGSTYNGLDLTLQKRFSEGLQFRANYTFSKAIDNAGDFVQAQQPNDPYTHYTPSAERSVSNEDQRHRFTLTGVWQLPYHGARGQNRFLRAVAADWTISSLVTVRSGIPYNVTVGSDVNGDQNSSTDRPLVGGAPLDATRTRGRAPLP